MRPSNASALWLCGANWYVRHDCSRLTAALFHQSFEGCLPKLGGRRRTAAVGDLGKHVRIDLDGTGNQAAQNALVHCATIMITKAWPAIDGRKTAGALRRLRLSTRYCSERKVQMSRYFFNVYDGETMFDEEGTNLKSIKEMRFYMMTLATEMLMSTDLQKDIWQMEVLDDAGRIVASMNFGVEGK